MDRNDALRQEIVAGLERAGIDAATLSRNIGRSKDYIREFLSGRKRSIAQDAAEQIKAFLAAPIVAASEAVPGSASASAGQYRPPPALLGERNLNVYASVEGGSGAMMVFSNDPYSIVQRPWYVERDPDAFGVFLAGDSMEPVYEAGEIIIVSPRAPLIKGREAIFVAEPEGGDFRASLKRYRGQNDKHWLAKQFNPEQDLEFDRKVWKAYRVLGSFDG